jgi:hypothetical protein
MKLLDKAYNGAGPLRQFRKDQIVAYCRNAEPTAEDFADIEDLTLNRKHNVRSAVEALEPAFKGSGRVPDGFTVARALKAALKAHR